MLGGAYKQFDAQFMDDPMGEGGLYYRLTFATQRRTGFGPVRVTVAEARAFQSRFRWTARALVTLFILGFLIAVVGLASVPGIDAPSDGSAGPPASGAAVGGYIAVICLLFLLLGIGSAWAWRRPARLLVDRETVRPDPWPLDAA